MPKLMLDSAEYTQFSIAMNVKDEEKYYDKQCSLFLGTFQGWSGRPDWEWGGRRR